MINYFAYGSNMLSKRLFERIGRFNKIGVAYLDNHLLCFNKSGADESAKCNVMREKDSQVWGVVFEITLSQKNQLDVFEGVGHGYLPVYKEVHYTNKRVQALIYQAQHAWIDENIKPFDWYLRFVIDGAKEHKLPREYIEMLFGVDSVRDNNLIRCKENWALLEK